MLREISFFPLGYFRQVARATCFLFLVAAGSTTWAQQKANRLLPRYLTVGQPDQAAGAERLEKFRAMGIEGDYFLEFALEVLPRRGPRREIAGAWWGTSTASGSLTRVALRGSGSDAADIARLLVQNGKAPQVWRWTPEGGSPTVLPAANWFTPLAETNLSAFDLLMPFVHWPEWIYEGVTRVRGRAAHVFLMYPPEQMQGARPEMAGVRLYLDDQFGALLQAAQLGPDEKAVKTMTVLDLKKVEERWIVQAIDVRDEITRDKTQFVVREAKLGLDFSRALFEPAELAEGVRRPSA